MSHLRAARIAGLVFVAFASVLPAQSRVPLRPRLVAGADTNDAASYYAAGITLIERDPKTAADAFYWATRLEPTHADAFY
ncbi:MAG TPA: hypothetical protein VEA99_04690, partial [Gemmatimonadaceae bacterium]|nr:hypothetical protein [Gemmatimonadaceae bacterium]